MSAFGFILTILYVPGILSSATEPRWILAFVVLAGLFTFTRSTRFTSGHVLGLAILMLSSVSMLWSILFYDALYAYLHLLLLGLAFWVGAELTTLRPLLLGMAWGVAVNGVIQIIQLTFPDLINPWVFQSTAPAGTYINGHCLAEVASMVLVGLMASKEWRYVPLVLPSVFLQSATQQGARGVYVALAVMGLLWLWRTSRLAAAGALVGIALIVTVLIGSGAHNDSASHRFAIWRGTVNGLSWTGSGIGSFYSSFPLHGSGINLVRERPDHVHNDLLELAYELGPLGLVLVLAFVGGALVSPLRPERYILALFVVLGFKGFPLYMPVTAILGLLCAGRLYGRRDRLWEFLHPWGVALRLRLLAHGFPARAVPAVRAGAALLPAQPLVPNAAGLSRGDPPRRRRKVDRDRGIGVGG